MLVVRSKPGHRDEKYVLRLPGGMEAVFRHGTLRGRKIFAALVPDDHERCAEIAARFRARQDGKFRIEEGVDDVVQWGHPIATPSTGGKSYHPATIAALQNGWAVEDLVGTGKDGNPGPRGGASTRTGLFLAQMAMCAAPPGWADVAADLWPWEVDGWKPPGLGWKPPALPSKRTPVVDPATIDPDRVVLTDLATGEVVQPSTDGEPTPAAELVPDDPSAPRLDPDAPDDPDDWVDSEERPEPPADDAPADHLALMTRLYEEADKTVPSLPKVRYHIDKHGLPKISKAVYEEISEALTS